MSTFIIHVQVPEAIRELGYSDEEIGRELLMLLVLQRFRQGVLSSSKAARILGLSRREFLDVLAREGVPLYNPTDQELLDEWETVQRLEAAGS